MLYGVNIIPNSFKVPPQAMWIISCIKNNEHNYNVSAYSTVFALNHPAQYNYGDFPRNAVLFCFCFLYFKNTYFFSREGVVRSTSCTSPAEIENSHSPFVRTIIVIQNLTV